MPYILKYIVRSLVLMCCFSAHAQFEPFFGSDTTVEIVRRNETFFYKGKVEVHSFNHQLVSKGKTLFGRKHGKWKVFDPSGISKKVRYRFGVIRSEIRTSKGRKAKLLLGVGKPMFFPTCQEAIDRFKLKKVQVAGCLVNGKIMYRVGLHNFFVLSGVVIQHGFNWEEKYWETCHKARKQE